MDDIALWLVIVVEVWVVLCGTAVSLSPTVKATIEARAKEPESWLRAYGCSAALTIPVLAGAWCWHAVNAGDWRYFVVGLAPLVGSLVRVPVQAIWTRRARKRQPERHGVPEGATPADVGRTPDTGEPR